MVEKSISPALKTIDLCGKIWWVLFRNVIKILIIFSRWFFLLVREILHGIGKINFCRKFCEWLENFFRVTGKIFYYLFILPWLAGKFIGKKCDISVSARRTFLFFSFVICGLYFFYFTPSFDWGTWYYLESGVASHYGRGFYFKRTSSGEWFLPGPFYTAAHRTLPLGTLVLVINDINNRRVVVKINDRGPFIDGRDIDLSGAAASRLDIVQNGTAPVTIYSRTKILGSIKSIKLPEWLNSN